MLYNHLNAHLNAILQVKCMRVLQYFPPPDDPMLKKSLVEILRAIITGTEVVKNLNKNNAQHAIVFEAVALALAIEADTEVLNAGVALLGKFITVRVVLHGMLPPWGRTLPRAGPRAQHQVPGSGKHVPPG